MFPKIPLRHSRYSSRCLQNNISDRLFVVLALGLLGILLATGCWLVKQSPWIGLQYTQVLLGSTFGMGGLVAIYTLWVLRRDRHQQATQIRQLIDGVPDAVVSIDTQGLIQEWNPQASQMFGWSAAEALGQPLATLIIPTQLRKAHLHGLQHYNRTGQGRLLHTRVTITALHRHGHEFPIELTLLPRAMPTGKGFTAFIRDITERLRSEEEVRASETRFRQFAEHLPYALWMSTPDRQHFLYVNPEYERLFACCRTELYAAPHLWMASIDANDRPRLLQANQELATGGGYCEEFRLVCPDGTLRWLREHAIPIHTEQGELSMVVGIVQDMTLQHQGEQILQEDLLINSLETAIHQALTQNDALEAMMQQCVEAIVYHLDAAFTRIWTLNEAAQMLELQASAGMYTHLDGAHSRIAVGQFKIGLIAQERAPHLTNNVLDDPRIADHVWAEHEGMVAFAGYPLLVGEHLVGVIALFARHALSAFTMRALETIANIIAYGIERLRAQQALAQSEKRFRQLAEHIHEVFYLVELKGPRLLYVSPGYESLWGRSIEAIYEGTLQDVLAPIHQEDRPSIEAAIAGLYAGRNSALEYRIIRPDGEMRWVLDRFYPILDAAGKPYRMAGVQEDITTRKCAEAALQQANEHLEQRVSERTDALQQANHVLTKAARLKDEFLASMSHELRTPLNAILGMSEALEEEVYGSLNTRQRKSLRSITESGQHLLALINDILDLSKITAGKLLLDIQPLTVAALCHAELRLLEKNAQAKQLRIILELDPAVRNLSADQRRLKQILGNLLSNAVKFTPTGGTIGLQVHGDQQSQTMNFTIWDTGIGIAQEDFPHLFKPFVQLDSSLARHYEGTGLGLALVKHLTELHGGHVHLESTVGAGSRFIITLPWIEESIGEDAHEPCRENGSPPAIAGPSSPSQKVAASSKPLILLAEDNEINALTIVDYLEAKDYQVAVAHNGVQALAQARALHPALILMDVHMPEMDGLEAMSRLRCDPNAEVAATPILALTALAMQGDHERCLAAGANGYLSKPVSLKALLQAIEAQLLNIA